MMLGGGRTERLDDEDGAAEDIRGDRKNLNVARLAFFQRRQRLGSAGHEHWRGFLAYAVRLSRVP